MNLIVNMLRNIYNYTLFLQIRLKNWKEIVLISPNSIGEVFITCALAPAVKKTYNKDIVIYTQPHHKIIPSVFYPKVFKAVHSLPLHDLRKICKLSKKAFYSKNIKSLYLDGSKHNILYFHNLIYKKDSKTGLSITDLFRIMLEIPGSAKLEKPILPTKKEILQIQKKFSLKKPYALVFPGGNTRKPITGAIFKKIINKLKRKKINAFINNSNDLFFPTGLNDLKNVMVNLNIHEAFCAALGAVHVVGGVNGLTNMFAWAFSKELPKILVLHSDKYCYKYLDKKGNFEPKFKTLDRYTPFSVGMPEVYSRKKKNLTELQVTINTKTCAILSHI